jgi:hypothetical protein
MLEINLGIAVSVIQVQPLSGDEFLLAIKTSVLCPALLDNPAINYFVAQKRYAVVCDVCWPRRSVVPVDTGYKADRDRR